jgi:hypothetical protein
MNSVVALHKEEDNERVAYTDDWDDGTLHGDAAAVVVAVVVVAAAVVVQ